MSEGQIKLDPLPTEGGSAEALCLDGGSFIADVEKLHADRGNGQFRLYNWAFHIKDQETGRHVLWDLGMTSVMRLQSLRIDATDTYILGLFMLCFWCGTSARIRRCRRPSRSSRGSTEPPWNII